MPTNGMDSFLLAVLKAHNPWLGAREDQGRLLRASLPSPMVARAKQLLLDAGKAELVVGPRQSGKSTWIRSCLAGQEAPVLLLHAEEPRIRELLASPGAALHTLAGVVTIDTVLFLEEVQHLDDAGLCIKGIIDLDPRRRVIATGSSSFALGARTRESLAGRARRTQLLPFSLDEVLSLEPAAEAPALEEERCRTAWETLLVHGGYPRAWLGPDPVAELHGLAEAFVLKDASDLHAIDRPAAFRRLLMLAAADVGSLVNLSAWASAASVSRDTACRYVMDIASSAHVVRTVEPFVGGKRAELVGAEKVFFVDNGLRNVMFGGFAPAASRGDRGPLWENAVFSELMKRLDLLDSIQYWRSKNGAEVDLVIQRGGRLLGLEVKATPLARPQVSRGARSFIEAYEPARLGVVNASLRLDWEVRGTPVLFRRPWELGDILS